MTAPSEIEKACMSRMGAVWNGTEYEEKRVEMTNGQTRALITEARQEESIQDKLGDGFGEGSEERAFYYEHRDRYKRLADALEAATREPGEDYREALARVMDTLAYYHCRSVNPKADHPRMGYHAMTEDQREHLREKQSEAAEEIMRMVPSLSRAAVPDAAPEQHECALPGHAGCKRVVVDGEPWFDHLPAERDAGLLGGDPTEERLLAALNAYQRTDHEQNGIKRPYVYAENLDDWGPQTIARMRAALAAAGVAPREPSARVVTRGSDTDCAAGICLGACSHLMWYCDACTSEGGWGAPRDMLEQWAADHVCPPTPMPDAASLEPVILAAEVAWNGRGRREPLARALARDLAKHLQEPS